MWSSLILVYTTTIRIHTVFKSISSSIYINPSSIVFFKTYTLTTTARWRQPQKTQTLMLISQRMLLRLVSVVSQFRGCFSLGESLLAESNKLSLTGQIIHFYLEWSVAGEFPRWLYMVRLWDAAVLIVKTNSTRKFIGSTQGMGKHIAKVAETDPGLAGPRRIMRVRIIPQ